MESNKTGFDIKSINLGGIFGSIVEIDDIAVDDFDSFSISSSKESIVLSSI